MNYKIIETSSAYPDVLIFRDRTEDGSEIVTVHAIGSSEDNDDYIATDEIVFPSKEMAVSYIRDFSQESAEAWCNQQSIEF